jgi:hypothetical protein
MARAQAACPACPEQSRRELVACSEPVELKEDLGLLRFDEA